MNAVLKLDGLATAPGAESVPGPPLAPASRCEHEWAFVPPSRFKGRVKGVSRYANSRPREEVDRIRRYAETGVRICHRCGLWLEGEPGDAAAYERVELRDILAFWDDGFDAKAEEEDVDV